MESTLKALLKFSKSDSDFTIENVKEVLGPIYSEYMTFADILQVVHNAYMTKLITEPRFEVSKHKSDGLIFAPLKGSSRLDFYCVKLTDTFTIEQFYTSILIQMLNDFRFSRVDWCKEELA